MIFDEVLVDERTEQGALIPTDDQVIDVQVSERLQIISDELVARVVVVGAGECRAASRNPRTCLCVHAFQIGRVG